MWKESRCKSVRISDADITLFNKVTYLGIVFDKGLTFSVHIFRLSAKCVYHLRQLRVDQGTLTDDAAKTLVHEFITSRMDYCNSVFSRANSMHNCTLQSVLYALADGNIRVSHRQSETIYTGCRSHKGLNTSYAHLCIHVSTKWRHNTSPRHAYTCLNNPGTISSPLGGSRWTASCSLRGKHLALTVLIYFWTCNLEYLTPWC